MAVVLSGVNSGAYAQGYTGVMDSLARLLQAEINRYDTTEISDLLVSGFKRIDGQNCELASTLTLDLETGLSKGVKRYRLLDRQNLEALAEEHKLAMEGMMDEEQRMREAGMLLKADVMVFGYYTYSGDILMLRLKAIDIQTSEQISIQSGISTPDAIIKSLCGSAPRKANAQSTSQNPVFEQKPQTVTVNYNTPPPSTSECATQNVGSYCFTNNGKVNVSVNVRFAYQYGRKNESLLITPGSTECFYDKPVGAHDYSMSEVYPRNPVYPVNNTKMIRQGSLRFEKCGNGRINYP
jgi:hypothetical protein